MTTFIIPQPIPNPTPNPEPAHPGLETKIGDVPNFRETTASKKVDDISKHESKHDMTPKHEPRPIAREKNRNWAKPGESNPQGGNNVPGTVKK